MSPPVEQQMAMAGTSDLMGRGSDLIPTLPSWSAEAWLPQRLSVRAALLVYVVAAVVGWAGIVALAYGARALLDEARTTFEISYVSSDTHK